MKKKLQTLKERAHGNTYNDDEWISMIQEIFFLEHESSLKLFKHLLCFTILRPIGEGNLYLDEDSIENLQNFLTFL